MLAEPRSEDASRIASPTRTSSSLLANEQFLIGCSSLTAVTVRASPSKWIAHSSPIASRGRPAGEKIVYRIQNASGRSGWFARSNQLS